MRFSISDSGGSKYNLNTNYKTPKNEPEHYFAIVFFGIIIFVLFVIFVLE